jgi:hypothetical protein
MNASSVHFICFGESPRAHLSALESQVLAVIENARGFFARDGMTCRSVAIRFARASALDNPPSGLGPVLARLRKKGLVRSERRDGLTYWRKS